MSFDKDHVVIMATSPMEIINMDQSLQGSIVSGISRYKNQLLQGSVIWSKISCYLDKLLDKDQVLLESVLQRGSGVI